MCADRELLHRYAREGDEAAFAEIVRRQTDLVYSVALRVTANGALAQEVTQTVFALLARRAAALAHYDTLVGWLHTTTRHTAINAVRGEERRRRREQEATAMQITDQTPTRDWEQLRPMLDEAVGGLREDDRKAVLLRFFKNLSHQEVGAELGLSEDTARKRVERALEKLRNYFARRGVTTTAAVLAAAISANSVQAAPAGLAEKIIPSSLAGIGGTSAASPFLFALIMSTKTKTILAFVIILALVATLAVKLRSPGASAPTATVPFPAPAEAGVAKAPPVPTQVAAPVVHSVPAATVAADTGAASPAIAKPDRTNLKSTVPAIIHLLETDDFVGIIDYVLPPADATRMLQSGLTREELGAKLRQELEAHGGVATLLNALRSIQDREPDMDATGTHATYKLDVAFAGHKEIGFTKTDGIWYGPD
ncbi:MAG TPA: sigma-70 family RNA polymerase sigma factor [Opitutales bacterium]|nr:sigma-70 family RNA polymerase sigma factor [Opitutales bacterium]